MKKENNKYIGISENKLHHILSVARKAYKVAKEFGKDEDFCRRMFMIGWVHDVGYEFSEYPEEHPRVSLEMFNQLIYTHEHSGIPLNQNSDYAIGYHGKFLDESFMRNEEWRFLNIADLTINSKGEEVPVEERLREVGERYGRTSSQYLSAWEVARIVGLTDPEEMTKWKRNTAKMLEMQEKTSKNKEE